ncbi:uncharacterized protein F4807DRAFT_424996 [Annulohypoxylon truncatum]|uniref:uncharacterized protein n=1 Tax=Annulohypoxylon truncatum TaxID=327061 RepID=UPI002007D9EC|nr:uncharacterized protein F4807DRAFT_424996 [Annulohypoxylon truncatum]KAI1209948.1 hypothetical protein F4807DRAFT_424996 [Annulohypoxylon truncatum]
MSSSKLVCVMLCVMLAGGQSSHLAIQPAPRWQMMQETTSFQVSAHLKFRTLGRVIMKEGCDGMREDSGLGTVV